MTDLPDQRRPAWVDAVILVVAGAAFVAMVALGNWQMSRLAWKLDLIEQVESNAFGDPIAVRFGKEMPEYQRVTLSGIYRYTDSLTIKALTDLGPGSWVLTPLETEAGIVWINRGFVPSGLDRSQWQEADSLVEVTGLVRATQPDGTLLEKNDPEQERWYSADVAAMSEAFGFVAATPFFVDAEHIGPADAWPRGGLTKLEFRNKHFSYALTWYAMAALFLGGMIYVIWDRRNARLSAGWNIEKGHVPD